MVALALSAHNVSLMLCRRSYREAELRLARNSYLTLGNTGGRGAPTQEIIYRCSYREAKATFRYPYTLDVRE